MCGLSYLCTQAFGDAPEMRIRIVRIFFVLCDMESKFLHINSRDELLRIDISKIVYFEADGNYTNIILMNGLKGVVCINLAKMQELLTSNMKQKASIFMRLGKKYIINHTYVYRISVLKQKLVLSDGCNFIFSLSISREALKKLKGMYV